MRVQHLSLTKDAEPQTPPRPVRDRAARGSGTKHELRPGVSMTGGYYRNWYGNFTVTDNLLRGSGDFSPYCVTAPLNPNLPGGGGFQVCGVAFAVPCGAQDVTTSPTQTWKLSTARSASRSCGGGSES